MIAPIDEFLQEDIERDLILESPFLNVDVLQIIDAYEEGARRGETEASLLASIYGDIKDQGEGADSMNDAGKTYAGLGKPTLSTDQIPNNPFADCFRLSLNLPKLNLQDPIACLKRLEFKSGNLPLPGFLTLFDDIIAQVQLFIIQMGKLLDKSKFFEEVCLLADAMRFMCPQDIRVILAGLHFRLLQLILQSIKFEFNLMAVVGLLMFPLFLLVYVALDTIGSVALGPLKCAFQFLDGFKEMRQDIEQAANQVSGQVGYVKQLVANQPQDNSSVDKESNLPTTTPSKSDNQTESSDKTANRISSQELQNEKTRNKMRGDLSSFDSMLSQLSSVDQQIVEMTDTWRRGCKAILALLTKEMVDKMDYTLQIVEIIRLISFLFALLDAMENKDLCRDPLIPLSPDDIIDIIDGLPDVETGTDDGDKVTINVNDAGSLVVRDPVLNQTFLIPQCIGSVSSSVQSEIASWIEELEASGS